MRTALHYLDIFLQLGLLALISITLIFPLFWVVFFPALALVQLVSSIVRFAVFFEHRSIRSWIITYWILVAAWVLVHFFWAQFSDSGTSMLSALISATLLSILYITMLRLPANNDTGNAYENYQRAWQVRQKAIATNQYNNPSTALMYYQVTPTDDESYRRAVEQREREMNAYKNMW